MRMKNRKFPPPKFLCKYLGFLTGPGWMRCVESDRWDSGWRGGGG